MTANISYNKPGNRWEITEFQHTQPLDQYLLKVTEQLKGMSQTDLRVISLSETLHSIDDQLSKVQEHQGWWEGYQIDTLLYDTRKCRNSLGAAIPNDMPFHPLASLLQLIARIFAFILSPFSATPVVEEKILYKRDSVEGMPCNTITSMIRGQEGIRVTYTHEGEIQEATLSDYIKILNAALSSQPSTDQLDAFIENLATINKVRTGEYVYLPPQEQDTPEAVEVRGSTP